MATEVAFHTPTGWGQWDRNYTFGNKVSVNKAVKILGLKTGVGLDASSSAFLKVAIWHRSNYTQLASGQLSGPFTAGTYYTVNFNSPVTLDTSADYIFTVYSSASNGPYLAFNSSATTVHTHIGAGVTFTVDGSSTFYALGDVAPTSYSSAGEMIIWPIVQTNEPPSIPTGVAVTNSPVPTGVNPSVTWTHNDPNSDPQSKYQIRWRKKD